MNRQQDDSDPAQSWTAFLQCPFDDLFHRHQVTDAAASLSK